MNVGPIYRHIEVELLTPTIGATLHGVRSRAAAER